MEIILNMLCFYFGIETEFKKIKFFETGIFDTNFVLFSSMNFITISVNLSKPFGLMR